jgi:serine protease Do
MKTMKSLLASSILVGGLALGVTATHNAEPLFFAQTDGEVRERQVRRELGTFAQLAKELNPSVVNISVVKTSRTGAADLQIPEEFRRMIPKEMLPRGGGEGRPEVSGQGSGVIVSSDGEVLTNNHVVEGATEIRVKLFDGRELDAEVLGTDENTDLALLKLKDTSNLPVARLGDSNNLEVGDWVMAIGNPFGLEATVTVGVLSGKGRVIGAGPYDDFLQTDTSINPGNSGGPLFNIEGEVVGINTAIVRGGQGIGFSIPINLAKSVAAQLKDNGEVERGFIGVGIQPMTPALKSALSIPADISGALVTYVMEDGPAEAAGLEHSDVILSVDNQPVRTDRELLKEVAKLQAGSTVPIEVLRDGKRETLSIRIAPRPEKPMASAPKPDKPARDADDVKVGIAVTDSPEQGAVVTQVVPNSPAARAGIRRGDKIRAVGQLEVETARQFVDAVTQWNQGDLALLVERGGRRSFVLIED